MEMLSKIDDTNITSTTNFLINTKYKRSKTASQAFFYLR
jgi:hypothetical protein